MYTHLHWPQNFPLLPVKFGPRRLCYSSQSPKEERQKVTISLFKEQWSIISASRREQASLQQFISLSLSSGPVPGSITGLHLTYLLEGSFSGLNGGILIEGLELHPLEHPRECTKGAGLTQGLLNMLFVSSKDCDLGKGQIAL